jgi:hypothetical protein
MSHLQPRFIAQAKARNKQSRAPHSMPANMLKNEASRFHIEQWFSLSQPPRRCYENCFSPNYRVFSLRK